MQAPALQVRGQVHGVEHARKERLADRAGLHQLADLAVRGGVTQMMVGAHDHAGLGAGGDHLPCVGDGHRQRLLAQDVLARRGGSERLRLVQLVGGADIDGADLGVGQ